MALETSTLRKLSLSELNVFWGGDDKIARVNEKQLWTVDIKQHNVYTNRQ